MDTSKSDVLREQKAVETIFTHVMDYVHGAAGCQKATLYLTDSENFELWTIAAVGENRIRMPLNQGLAGKSVTLDKTLNVADAYESPDFFRGVDKDTGFKTQSVLCRPIHNATGDIVGVLQLVNKMEPDGTIVPFDKRDELLVSAFSHHLANAIEGIVQPDSEKEHQLITALKAAKSHDDYLASLSDLGRRQAAACESLR